MNTKLIISCIGGTGALGGVVAGSYYLLNKETEKAQQVTNANSQQEETVREKTPVSNPKKTLKDQLAIDGFVALKTDGREDDKHWKTLIKKHKDSGVSGKKIKIDGTLEENPSDDDLANIQKLQTACTKLLAKTDDISPEDKEIAKSWCNQKSTLIG